MVGPLSRASSASGPSCVLASATPRSTTSALNFWRWSPRSLCEPSDVALVQVRLPAVPRTDRGDAPVDGLIREAEGFPRGSSSTKSGRTNTWPGTRPREVHLGLADPAVPNLSRSPGTCQISLARGQRRDDASGMPRVTAATPCGSRWPDIVVRVATMGGRHLQSRAPLAEHEVEVRREPTVAGRLARLVESDLFGDAGADLVSGMPAACRVSRCATGRTSVTRSDPRLAPPRGCRLRRGQGGDVQGGGQQDSPTSGVLDSLVVGDSQSEARSRSGPMTTSPDPVVLGDLGVGHDSLYRLAQREGVTGFGVRVDVPQHGHGSTRLNSVRSLANDFRVERNSGAANLPGF